MTHQRFFISDLHLGHENILKFNRDDGLRLRPFVDLDHMHEHMITCWNSVVRPYDKVYVLGDVSFSRKTLPILSKLQGKKVLVGGNHDVFKAKDYLQYFVDMVVVKVFPERIVATHIPIHSDCMDRWKLNIHGHLHSGALDDPKYRNVSVERVNYVPVNYEEILEEIKFIDLKV